MEDYIDLDRRFIEFDPRVQGEQDQHSWMHSLAGTGKSWKEVLEQRCTVIVAEAGNGKSIEMWNQARLLRDRGEAAFFANLSLLAKLPLPRALEIGTSDDLSAWQHDTKRGFFFLDAVDEAKLADPRDFQVALANYLDAVEPLKTRITTVISTRPHAWQAYADRAILAARLGVSTPGNVDKTTDARTSPGEEPVAADDSLEQGDDGSEVRSPREPFPTIAIVQMEALDEVRVRTFARARGISAADLDAFITAIEHADADLFATRPADLPGLIRIWKKTGRIGTYSEVVAENIELKITEFNPAHQRFSIASEQAMVGAEMLAAAVTFTQRTSILVPDQRIGDDLIAQALNPADVLQGWSQSEIQVLLGRALFDEALYGTVRFHHRTTREYLTACWIKRCLKNYKNRRAVEHLLFAKIYGKGSPVVIPSMKPIVGWLAGWDQRIRDAALRVDPRVLLEHGDADALDIQTRARLLIEFAARYEARNYTPLSLNIREVRRLAHQGLSPVLLELLSRYRHHEDVRQLVLRVIREGVIAGCGAAVLPFALDHSMDAYTRSCAVQAVGIAGLPSERTQLAQAITAAAASLDSQILAAAIEVLWPGALTVNNIVTVLERAAAPEPYSSFHLDHQLERIADRLVQLEDRLSLLRSVTALLQDPPLHDEYRPISRRYDWLLPLATKLAHSLAVQSLVDPAVLSVLAMAASPYHLDHHAGDVRERTFELIRANRSIRHQLFWYLVEARRTHSSAPVTNWFSLSMRPEVSEFDAADFDDFTADIAQRSLMDDKRVALSAAVTIYMRQDKPPKLLDRLHRAVGSNVSLKTDLQEHLTPRSPSSDPSGTERRLAAIEARNRAKKRKDEESRATWIAELRADPSKVGDLSIASAGKVWRNTAWLADEIGRKTKGSNRWTIDQWELLESDLGSEVARAYRDFCVAFWRRYSPQLRSEGGQQSASVPWPVIIGLSGIAMQAQLDSAWSEKLTVDEAALVTRYALWEMNGLPPWFGDVYRAHPAPVSALLLGELRWEFVTPRPSESAGYVLARLRWTARELSLALRPQLIALVEEHEGADVTTIAEAMTLILSDGRPLPSSLSVLAQMRLEATEDDPRKALWFAVGLCLATEPVIPLLECWVTSCATPAGSEERLTQVLERVWGDRFDCLKSEHKAYLTPANLLRLLKLTHRHIREENDTPRNGAVTSRHSAQNARRHLLELLLTIPGERTYEALLELADFHTVNYSRDRMLALAEQRAEADAEHSAWPERDISQFAEEAERDPATEGALFHLALSRLDDLKLDLEEGDESESSLLRKVENEPELRRAIANRLRLAAHFKYTTGSEEELADRSRTDIRLHNPRVAQRVPIEIKIAGKWSGKQLKERLATQLGDQYLRAARHGIFLVVNREGNSDRKKWTMGRRFVDFDGLIDALSEEASGLLTHSATLDGLVVVGIDLVRRTLIGGQPNTKGSTTTSRRAGTKTPNSRNGGRRKRRSARRRDP